MNLLGIEAPDVTGVCCTHVPWIDGPLSGGLRPGGSYLLAGPPGSNKTTLAVQLAINMAARGVGVLFALTEQRPSDIQSIVRRVCDKTGRTVPPAAWDNLECEVLDRAGDLPSLMQHKTASPHSKIQVIIVDSLQGAGLPATATTEYRAVFDFLDQARSRGIIALIICHVTKDGKIAGPKTLEHKVDVSLVLRKAYKFRHLFICKNRFGPEAVEPIVLDVEGGCLAPSAHSDAVCASVLGFSGMGNDLMEVQASVSIPKLGGRAELTAPFLPAKRIKQLMSTVSKMPGVDLHEVSYAVNALVPSSQAYLAELDLPLAVALLSAYLHQGVSARAVFAGQVDLQMNIRPPSPSYLAALAGALCDARYEHIEHVHISSAAAGHLAELAPFGSDDEAERQIQVVGVRSVGELLEHIWPSTFGRSDKKLDNCLET